MVIALYRAVNPAELGKIIPMQHGEVTSVDMGALVLGSKGETAVETPAMGRSRNLEEQAGQPEQPQGLEKTFGSGASNPSYEERADLRVRRLYSL
ncbi:MAG: hypothetical protein LBD29_10025 [Treponema sp.]|nr:hypothetical protein [Treponema sp.]